MSFSVFNSAPFSSIVPMKCGSNVRFIVSTWDSVATRICLCGVCSCSAASIVGSSCTVDSTCPKHSALVWWTRCI
uniref:Uncharacterized protein n=1 Tax=Arundo donax TaxID=35708 RepID=A0A0A9FJE6_ARUDO